MKTDELKAILDAHAKWLRDEDGGSRAYLTGADLRGANLTGNIKISTLEVFSGLYKYECWAFVTVEGVPWIRMGWLWKSVKEWDKIGIRDSNTNEFPNDGSIKSERRARAYEFVRSIALEMATRS